MSVKITKHYDRMEKCKTRRSAVHKVNPAGTKMLVRFVKNRLSVKCVPRQAIEFYAAYAKGLGQ